MRTFLVLLAACFPIVALADGFTIFSKQEELKNKAVVEVGEAEQIKVETDGNKKELIKLNGKCYDPIGYVGFWRGAQAVLLLSDRNRVLSIAVIQSEIASIKIDVFQVSRSECAGKDDLPDDPQKAREFLKKKQDEILRQMDQFKKRKEAERN